MKRCLLILTLLASLFAPFSAGPVQACPMCKAANEADQGDGEANLKPRAYMYSILFMISMPATLLGAFGFTFWRLSRRTGLDGADVADGI
jgi:hypothetical protein